MAKTERKRSSGQPAAAKAAKTARRTAVATGERTGGSGPVALPVTGASHTAARSRTKAGRSHTASKGRKLPVEVSRAVQAALDKKAQDVLILDLRGTPAFTDFFVLCSGLNQRQVKAIADAVEETERAHQVRPAHVEGYDRAEWVLMDFFTFIVHVFTPQTRAFYGLERLWGDAERINVSEEAATGS